MLQVIKTITNEVKAKIFAQYYGVKCFRNEFYDKQDLDSSEIIDRTFAFVFTHNGYLSLKSLDNIIDEDAIELFNLMFSKQHLDKTNDFKLELGKSWVSAYLRNVDTFAPFNYIYGFQFLQSKGYALPYMNYSVEDLVELGVYKLI